MEDLEQELFWLSSRLLLLFLRISTLCEGDIAIFLQGWRQIYNLPMLPEV